MTTKQQVQLVMDKVTPFQLSADFLEAYQGKQPEWPSELSYFVFKRTYARRIPNEDRTEEFFETLTRVVNGTFTAIKKHLWTQQSELWDEEEMTFHAEQMFKKMWTFKFLPPGRGLWMMGTEFVKKRGSIALNSCGFCSTRNIASEGAKPFVWCMDALMLGVGVGSDTRGNNTLTIQPPIRIDTPHIVADSREGWTTALGILIDAYFFGRELPVFDFSHIRPKGVPIKGFGGTSSGPDPLIELFDNLTAIFTERLHKPIRSIDIVDMFNNIGKCVIAGNVRRSAEIMLGRYDDKEFIQMKQNYHDQPKHRQSRWASNNSVIVNEEHDIDYSQLIENIINNGEPGIFWINNARKYSRIREGEDQYVDKNIEGCNPCSEQSLEDKEMCNLVETFPSNHESYREYEDTLRYAYLYAKSVTLIEPRGSLWTETRDVIKKNRRIGVGQSGITSAFYKHGRTHCIQREIPLDMKHIERYGRQVMQQWNEQGYTYLREIDRYYSSIFNIPESIKITTVKPSGTVSLLAGVPPGIHYPHAKYYIRRVRVSKQSKMFEFAQQLHVPMIPDTVYWQFKDGKPVFDADQKPVLKPDVDVETYVIEFPIHIPHAVKTKFNASVEDQLQNAFLYQHSWSDNQVSITVTFEKDPNIKATLLSLLTECEKKLKSVSFLPISEHGYHLAPYEAVSEEQYEILRKQMDKIDWNHLYAYNGNSKGEKWCTSDKCTLTFG